VYRTFERSREKRGIPQPGFFLAFMTIPRDGIIVNILKNAGGTPALPDFLMEILQLFRD